MTLRRVIFPGILAISLGLGFSSACSAPDPGLVIFSTNPDKIKGDAGLITISDGGGTDGGGTGAPPTAFDGEPAYVSTAGLSTDKSQHATLFGNQNPAGHDCMTCHEADATTPFKFGGTIFPPDSGSDAGATNVEVLIKNPDGTTSATYTNSEGNFFFYSSIGEPIAANALVGARNAASTEAMATHLTGPTSGGCNQTGTCHGGTQGTIHVP
jgi:hypothetical protein